MKETNVVPANSMETNVIPANSKETNVVPGISTETNVIPAATETNIFSSINNIGFSFHNTQPSRSLQSINVVSSPSVMSNLAVSQLEPEEEKQGTTEENPEEQGNNQSAYRWWADREWQYHAMPLLPISSLLLQLPVTSTSTSTNLQSVLHHSTRRYYVGTKVLARRETGVTLPILFTRFVGHPCMTEIASSEAVVRMAVIAFYRH